MSDPADLRCESCAAPREIVHGSGAERCAYCGSVFGSAIVTPDIVENLERLESQVGSIDDRLARLALPGQAAFRQAAAYPAGIRLLSAVVVGFFFCPIGMIPSLPFILVAHSDPNNLIFNTFTIYVVLAVMLLSSTFALTLFVSIVSGNAAPIKAYGGALRAVFEAIGRMVLSAGSMFRPTTKAR